MQHPLFHISPSHNASKINYYAVISKDTNMNLQPTVGTVLLNSLLTNRSARLDFPTPEPPRRTILTLRVRTGLPQVSLRPWVPTGSLCVINAIK